MSIRELSYFLAAAEEQNFTVAAEKLYITQQTLSSHIKHLEFQYGVKLFERRPRLTLTPSGECMMRYATRIVRLERLMSSEFSDISKKARGVLVLGCSRARARSFFPEIWQIYRSLYPNIEIKMVEGNSSYLEACLLAKKVDLCIGINIAERLQLQQEPLFTERVYFVISRKLFYEHFGEDSHENVKRFASGITFRDILGIPLILLPPENYIRKVVDMHAEETDTIATSVFESNDSEMILKMCASGNGGCFLSESALFLPLDTATQRLQNLYMFQLIGASLSPVIAYPTDLPLPHYSQEFIRICRQVFSVSLSNIRAYENSSLINL